MGISSPYGGFPRLRFRCETPFDAQAPFEYGWSNTTFKNVDAGTYINRGDNPKAGGICKTQQIPLFFMRATEDFLHP
ncbi:hypothetical protein N7494_013091 [Penicillium frequentans]|uniref:Uncharacterized protein n=1 Tax=Penicillium frequentans TaxID=3151616 RepID=A0AAD6CNE4_9EURO|nr:hypothetical protein N7494_013091 [Penicillium glabrum]